MSYRQRRESVHVQGRGRGPERKEHSNLTLLGIGSLFLCSAALIVNSFVNSITDSPEKLVGFPEVDQGIYEPARVDIPTELDIIRVEKVPDERYTVEISEDGSVITYTGFLCYEVQDDIGSRNRGLYTREDRIDTRRGSVTLRRK